MEGKHVVKVANEEAAERRLPPTVAQITGHGFKLTHLYTSGSHLAETVNWSTSLTSSLKLPAPKLPH